MNVLAVLSCLSLLLAAAVAQPKPCVSPELLSGGVTVMTETSMETTGTISYDAIGQRVKIKLTDISGNGTASTELLLLYHEKAYYEIDWARFSCKKKPLTTDFSPLHVPKDANLMAQIFLGSSSSWGMGVLANTWYGYLPGNGMYTYVFTEIGCIPMTLTSYTPQQGWITISTFNWVLGNTNPMEYSPPFICNWAKLEEAEAPENMFTILKAQALKSRE